MAEWMIPFTGQKVDTDSGAWEGLAFPALIAIVSLVSLFAVSQAARAIWNTIGDAAPGDAGGGVNIPLSGAE